MLVVKLHCFALEGAKLVERLHLSVSELFGTESIAARDVSRFQANREPTGALCRRAVGEGVRDNVSLALFLQSIIADRRSRL